MFEVTVSSVQQTQAVGRVLAEFVRGGDLIMLSGDLGTGKTTLTQGLGAALGVSGRVSSPTFIIARVHPGNGGPDLVHVDAYRIDSMEDLETLDLDTSLPRAVVVVEWGEGKTESLSEDRLQIELFEDTPQEFPAAQAGAASVDLTAYTSGTRRLRVTAVGQRWQAAEADLEQRINRGVEEA